MEDGIIYTLAGKQGSVVEMMGMPLEIWRDSGLILPIVDIIAREALESQKEASPVLRAMCVPGCRRLARRQTPWMVSGVPASRKSKGPSQTLNNVQRYSTVCRVFKALQMSLSSLVATQRSSIVQLTATSQCPYDSLPPPLFRNRIRSVLRAYALAAKKPHGAAPRLPIARPMWCGREYARRRNGWEAGLAWSAPRAKRLPAQASAAAALDRIERTHEPTVRRARTRGGRVLFG